MLFDLLTYDGNGSTTYKKELQREELLSCLVNFPFGFFTLECLYIAGLFNYSVRHRLRYLARSGGVLQWLRVEIWGGLYYSIHERHMPN